MSGDAVTTVNSGSSQGTANISVNAAGAAVTCGTLGTRSPIQKGARTKAGFCTAHLTATMRLGAAAAGGT